MESKYGNGTLTQVLFEPVGHFGASAWLLAKQGQEEVQEGEVVEDLVAFALEHSFNLEEARNSSGKMFIAISRDKFPVDEVGTKSLLDRFREARQQKLAGEKSAAGA